MLDALIAGLADDARGRRQADDRAALLDRLERARAGPREPAESRSLVQPTSPRCASPCRTDPGVLAEVTTLAAELGVNICDIEIAHSAEGNRGVVIMLVEASNADLFRGGLIARGYRPSVQRLE